MSRYTAARRTLTYGYSLYVRHMPQCDIIIPTHNNAKVLPLTLAALTTQSYPDTWQLNLIIIDDGSTDRTATTVHRFLKESGWTYQWITQAAAGSAAARNRGIAASSADVLFFLGADIVLRPGALEHHLRFHEHYSSPTEAALGVVKWDPRLRPTPFMQWMIHGGPQNNFDELLGVTWADPTHFFYAANLSVKRAALPTPAFSTDFKKYGWEDLELGRRLASHGLRLKVLHDALGLHRHHYSVTALGKRQRAVGSGLVLYQRKYPSSSLLPKASWWRRIRRWIFIHSGAVSVLRVVIRVMNTKGWSTPHLFLALTSGDLWIGVQKGVKSFPH